VSRVIAPRAPHFSVQDTGAALVVTIPAHHRWGWIAGLGLGTVFVPFVLVGLVLAWAVNYTPGGPGRDVASLIFGLVYAVVFGPVMVYALLWHLAGREVITANTETLIVRREALGIGRTRCYAAGYVRDVRAAPAQTPRGPSLRSLGLGPERLAFDYGARTLRAGILGLGRTRDYDLAHVRRLRAAPPEEDALGNFFGQSGGRLAFDYGADTVRCGAGLDEFEAEQLAGRIGVGVVGEGVKG
jgi:hypothetical protein